MIRANRELPVRLDGVYRRGEVYMRLLQRGCSVFFGTRVGRWLTRYVALPFGGSFLLLEAFRPPVEAGEDFADWLTGWDGAVQGLAALDGGIAGYAADNSNPAPGRALAHAPRPGRLSVPHAPLARLPIAGHRGWRSSCS